MTSAPSPRPAGALRARMIEDMTVRGFAEKTRNDYVRHVQAFAAFIRRPPDTATAEDLRRFQLHQTQSGMQPPSVNSAVSALRFTNPSPPSGWVEDFHLRAIEHARHTTNPLSREGSVMAGAFWAVAVSG